MSVIDQNSRISYRPSVNTTSLIFPFRIFNDSDVLVYKNSNLLVPNEGYTIDLLQSGEGGVVNLLIPSSLNDTYVIQRDVPITQSQDFVTGGEFTSNAIVYSLDKLTVAIQQAESLINDLGLKYPISSFVENKDRNIPILGANQIWKKNSLDTEIIAVTIDDGQECATLRSELASETDLSNGSRLVGYYSADSGHTTVNSELAKISNEKPAGVNFSKYGAVGDGVYDCTESFNRFLADLSANTLYIDNGEYLFNSALNPIQKKINVIGESEGGTILSANYTDEDEFSGFVTFSSGSSWSSFKNLSFKIKESHILRSIISNISTETDSQSNISFSNIDTIIEGGNYHAALFDGILNSSYIENIRIENCKFNSTLSDALYMRKVMKSKIEGKSVSLSGNSINLDSSAQLGGCTNIFINGLFDDIRFEAATNIDFKSTYLQSLTMNHSQNVNAMATKIISTTVHQSTNCSIHASAIPTFNITNSNRINIYAETIGSIITDNTASYISVYAYVTSLSGSWVNSSIISASTMGGATGVNGFFRLPCGTIYQRLYHMVSEGIHNDPHLALPIPFPNNNLGVISAWPSGSLELTPGGNTLSSIFAESTGNNSHYVHFVVIGN